MEARTPGIEKELYAKAEREGGQRHRDAEMQRGKEARSDTEWMATDAPPAAGSTLPCLYGWFRGLPVCC
jgi:hypothetical protein